MQSSVCTGFDFRSSRLYSVALFVELIKYLIRARAVVCSLFRTQTTVRNTIPIETQFEVMVQNGVS